MRLVNLRREWSMCRKIQKAMILNFINSWITFYVNTKTPTTTETIIKYSFPVSGYRSYRHMRTADQVINGRNILAHYRSTGKGKFSSPHNTIFFRIAFQPMYRRRVGLLEIWVGFGARLVIYLQSSYSNFGTMSNILQPTLILYKC